MVERTNPMAESNDALAIRYTDQQYATKQAFFKDLGSSLVTSLWTRVENYRQAH